MKKVVQTIVVLASTALFTGCPDGGGGNQAQPPIIGVPSGTVASYNDPNTYCSFDQANRVFTCYARNSFTGQTCNTQAVGYTDLNSMCQQVYAQLQQGTYGGQCNVTSALQRVYSEYCQYNSNYPQNPNFPNNPIQNGQMGMKMIQCQFQAQRTNGGYFSGNLNTGMQTQTFQINPSIRNEILLHTSLFNIGSFGQAKLVFSPAGLRANNDIMTLSIKGLNRETEILQSGFAGQKVSLEAQNNDGSMNIFLNCEGKSQFQKVSHKRFTQYVCKGNSNLVSRGKKVDFRYNYGSSLVDTEFKLAPGLKMTVIGDSSHGDNARVEFIAEDSSGDQIYKTSSYLKTVSQLKIDTAYGAADITCIPQ